MSEEKLPGQGPIDLTTALDKRRIEKQQEIQARMENDIRSVMKTAGGRRFVNRFLIFCGAFENPYVPDSDQTIFNTGLKSAGLYLMNMILRVCPEEFMQMQSESRSQKIQDDKEVHKP